jgi:SIR2-like domain
VTTNFDTLFERAAVFGMLDNVRTYSGKSIPRAGAAKDAGIFHLHGCIGDSDPKVEASDLILTSADFGDAYLRDGWASQYIEDRMRVGILVLVGYQAEDAAMRLLLETLDADRQRFRDLKPIYAIERQTADSASIWKSKGITPIEFSTFAGIYETLREWAEYAADAKNYRTARMKSILLKPGVTP